jgi:hypothetical protein
MFVQPLTIRENEKDRRKGMGKTTLSFLCSNITLETQPDRGTGKISEVNKLLN